MIQEQLQKKREGEKISLLSVILLEFRSTAGNTRPPCYSRPSAHSPCETNASIVYGLKHPTEA